MNERSIVKQLENLNTTADRALGGLQADRHLMLKIEKAAATAHAEPPRHRNWTPVLACAMVLALFVAIGVPALQPQPKPIITAQSAGDGRVSNEVALNLPTDRVSISRSGDMPSYRSLWEESSGTFPLVGSDGRYYRMMSSPANISESLLGESLGTVAEYTTEPSLSGTDVILSNIAAFGTEVFAIKGMENTLVAASVDGSMRLFQRVSFNGSALRGNEELADTLQISGSIKAMELSDVGVISDAAVCETLFDTLLDCASYESSGALSGRQSLLIELDNGLVVQMSVRDENLSACGTWSCPEFFEAFEEAVK